MILQTAQQVITSKGPVQIKQICNIKGVKSAECRHVKT